MLAESWTLSADRGAAACGDRLDLVDEAYRKPGGPAGVELARHYCPRCPLALDCLSFAMTSRQEGVWGGATPHLRTKHGGPRRPNDPTKA